MLARGRSPDPNENVYERDRERAGWLLCCREAGPVTAVIDTERSRIGIYSIASPVSFHRRNSCRSWSALAVFGISSSAAGEAWTRGTGRALVGTDGFTLLLDPAEWPDGDIVVRSIEARIDPRLFVSINSPGPGRPKPEPDPAATPSPPQAVTPGKVTARPSWGSRILLAVNICVVIFGVLAIAGGDATGGIAFVLIGVMGLAWQQLRIRRTTRLGRDVG